MLLLPGWLDRGRPRDPLDQLAEVSRVGGDVGGGRALRRPGLALLGDPPGERILSARRVACGQGSGLREEGDPKGLGEDVVLTGEGRFGVAGVGAVHPRIENRAVLRHGHSSRRRRRASQA